MNISLKQTADILTKNENEVMFLVQQNQIQAGVNKDTLAWEFVLADILEYKKNQEVQE